MQLKLPTCPLLTSVLAFAEACGLLDDVKAFAQTVKAATAVSKPAIRKAPKVNPPACLYIACLRPTRLYIPTINKFAAGEEAQDPPPASASLWKA